MANVLRFTLPTARDLNIAGVGNFEDGVLDVPVNDLEAMSRARYRVQPYGAVEVGIVAEGTAAPTLPAVPGPANPDPYPQYPTMDEIVASPALRAALGSPDPVLSDFVYESGTGNLLSYKEDGVPIVLTYNADGTVATSKRGTAPAKAFSYSGGNLAGVA